MTFKRGDLVRTKDGDMAIVEEFSEATADVFYGNGLRGRESLHDIELVALVGSTATCNFVELMAPVYANSLHIATAPDTPVQAVAEAMINLVLRGNDMRVGLQKPKAALAGITIHTQEIRLTQEERNLLQKASITGYRDHIAFLSPFEVRQFFRRETFAMMGDTVRFSDEELAAMAEVVIKSRTHCEF